jgi:hypothetical protein
LQALSRQDLSTLMLVCSKVDPDVLFDSHPCPLTQPVVLALIQQLATKLEAQTELKFRSGIGAFENFGLR